MYTKFSFEPNKEISQYSLYFFRRKIFDGLVSIDFEG